jgi:homoserine kinase
MSWSTVRVPASSANIGPGFDALGLALCVYLDCRFRASDRLSITVTGRDAAAISTGERNLIWQTALSVAADVRMQLPPIERRGAHRRRGHRRPLVGLGLAAAAHPG